MLTTGVGAGCTTFGVDATNDTVDAGAIYSTTGASVAITAGAMCSTIGIGVACTAFGALYDVAGVVAICSTKTSR